jgi:hypothetical protein
MTEHEKRRRRTAPMRVAVTSLLVASGVTVVGVVPALAAGDSPTSVAHRSDDDRDRGRDHDRWFSARGDVRYVWFRVCDTDATTTTTTTPETTTETPVPDTTTETVAPDAIAAAVEGASTETATSTDTVTGETTTDTTTTEPTPDTTTADDEADDEGDGKVYPTFIVVPLPKDEAKALRKLDDRPCYDLATGAPATTDPTTTATTETTTTETTTDAATVVETPTATPADTGSTG